MSEITPTELQAFLQKAQEAGPEALKDLTPGEKKVMRAMIEGLKANKDIDLQEIDPHKWIFNSLKRRFEEFKNNPDNFERKYYSSSSKVESFVNDLKTFVGLRTSSNQLYKTIKEGLETKPLPLQTNKAPATQKHFESVMEQGHFKDFVILRIQDDKVDHVSEEDLKGRLQLYRDIYSSWLHNKPALSPIYTIVPVGEPGKREYVILKIAVKKDAIETEMHRLSRVAEGDKKGWFKLQDIATDPNSRNKDSFSEKIPSLLKGTFPDIEAAAAKKAKQLKKIK